MSELRQDSPTQRSSRLPCTRGALETFFELDDDCHETNYYHNQLNPRPDSTSVTIQWEGFSNAFLTEAACKCLRLGSSSGKLNQTYHIETETTAVDVKIRKRDSLPGANFALLITLNKPFISFHFLKYAPRKARAPDCCLF